MITFNQENLKVGLRYASTALGGYFINSGTVSSNKWEFWSGIVIAAIAAGYGQFKTTTEQMAKTTDSLPGVLGVAVTPKIDAAISSSDTVTTPDKLVKAIAASPAN